MGVVGLAGCGGNGISTGGSPSDLGTVTVGVLNPITGAYSSLGPGQRNGSKLAVSQSNDSDEFDLELDAVSEDTGTEAGAARQSAQKVVHGGPAASVRDDTEVLDRHLGVGSVE